MLHTLWTAGLSMAALALMCSSRTGSAGPTSKHLSAHGKRPATLGQRNGEAQSVSL